MHFFTDILCLDRGVTSNCLGSDFSKVLLKQVNNLWSFCTWEKGTGLIPVFWFSFQKSDLAPNALQLWMAYVIVLLELLQKHILPIPSITTKHDIVHMKPSRNNRLFCAIQGGSGVACHLGWTRAWRKLHLQRCQAPRKALSARFFLVLGTARVFVRDWQVILQARTFISPPAAVCCQKADTKGSFFTVRPGPKKLCHRQKLRYTLAAQASDSILLALLVGWLTGKQLQSTCTQTTQVHGVFLQRRGGDFASWVAESCGSKTWLDQDLFLDLRSLMSVLGLYKMSTNSVEGSNDPGHMFIKRQSVRTLISALSLQRRPAHAKPDFNWLFGPRNGTWKRTCGISCLHP